MKPGYLGFKRLVFATRFSAQGLRATWQQEQAFRMEIYCLVAGTPLAVLVAESMVEFVLLLGSLLILITVELLNTALESVVDRIGKEHHPLSGQAKDQGSAAVLVAMLLCLLTWIGFVGAKLFS